MKIYDLAQWERRGGQLGGLSGGVQLSPVSPSKCRELGSRDACQLLVRKRIAGVAEVKLGPEG